MEKYNADPTDQEIISDLELAFSSGMTENLAELFVNAYKVRPSDF